jgi:hypothetical protein
MTRINTDYSAMPYSANAPANKKAQSNFSDTLASSISKTHTIASAAGLNSAIPSDFVSQLNAALTDFGIKVPPALRVSSGKNGLELVGDNRNVQFQAMLNSRPDLGSDFSVLLGQAQAGRQTALTGVMSAFAGDNPSASVSNFLDGFEASEKTATYSVRFNGAESTVQEKGENGWQPVKGEGDFMADLLKAYTEYMAKTQVISVTDKKDKKDDGADDALRKQLADAKQAGTIAGA